MCIRDRAEDNILPLLTSTVQNGRLTLGQQPGTSFRTTKPIVFHVTMKNVTSVAASGAGSISAPKLQADQLLVNLTGSGDASFGQLNASKVTFTVTGSGSVTAAGTTPSQEIVLEGAGKYQGQGLQSKTATVMVRGAGNAAVQVLSLIHI